MDRADRVTDANTTVDRVTIPTAVLPQAAALDTKALAASGDFRAIAYWINQPLIDQQVFAQVQSQQPGCLQINVEFYQPPDRDGLVRFLCHRIWHLNSPIIEGIHVVARTVGQPKPLWQARVRIVTPALKQRQAAKRQAAAQGQTRAGGDLPPTLFPRRPNPRDNRRLKLFRTFMLSGSAVAAFIMGCLVEVMSTRPSPSLPAFDRNTPAVTTEVDPLEITPISYTASDNPAQAAVPAPDRPNIVEAALEPVAVIPHQRVLAPHDPTVTLLFGGEVSLDDIPYEEHADPEGLFAEIEPYHTADLSMVGLGSTLTPAGTSLSEKYVDRTRPEAVGMLRAGGVDLVTLTSDAAMTHGELGLRETLTILDQGGLYRVGAGRNQQEARRPEILDVKGQRIAYLAYGQTMFQARGSQGGINAEDRQQIAEDISALRDQVDWIVVNYRWSQDLPEETAEWQTSLARLAIDQGADLVVGYHPDRIQGAEIYKGRPIAYSLGDLIFNDGELPQTRHDTAVLKVALRENQMRVEFVPVVVENAQPRLADAHRGAMIMQQIREASRDLPEPMQSPVILELKSPDQPVDLPPQSEDPDSFIQETGSDLDFFPDDLLQEPDAAPGFESEPGFGPGSVDQPLDLAPWQEDLPPGYLGEQNPLPEATAQEVEDDTLTSKPVEEAEVDLGQPGIDAATEQPQKLEVIGPYAEPLVGPLTVAPNGGDRSVERDQVSQAPVDLDQAEAVAEAVNLSRHGVAIAPFSPSSSSSSSSPAAPASAQPTAAPLPALDLPNFPPLPQAAE